MKHMAPVLLGVLLVGAIGPAAAFAESPTRAASVVNEKVRVANLRPDEIGPATYSEGKSLKTVQGPNVVQSGVVTTAVSASTNRVRKPGWYETRRTLVRRSWVGIWVYSLTVIGDYHSNGFIIDEYGSTDSATSSAITWSSNSERSSWAYKSKTMGKARASAKFVHSVPITPWGGIPYQEVTDSVTAIAVP